MSYQNVPSAQAASTTRRIVSLSEVYRTVPVPASAGIARKLLAFSGPGYLVAVGYMDPGNWATAIGILGATVMPHNLYLHSSIVQTRQFDEGSVGKREAIRYATIDSTIALMFALTRTSRKSRRRTACSRRKDQ